jgi:outer membrane lipoprotein-sorting protein
VSAMRNAGVLLVIALVACGERTQRAETDVRGDSVAPAPADAATGDTVPGAVNGAMAIPVDAGSERTGGDTPVSNEPAPPAPAGSNPPSARSPPGGAPQSADDAAAILRRAAAAYANVRALRAEFVMQYENTLLRQKTTSRGTLYQRQPDRIALRFSDPAGDVLIGDGSHFYWYLPSVDAKQVLCMPASQGGGSSGVDLQAQFVGDPVERFNATLHANESVDGRAANVLTLLPRERAEYRSLKVWLDTRDALARRFEITEQNGTVRRFDLDNMAVNPSIPDATFRFTRPENARIVGCQ